ncbi:hypothetical protein FRB93_000759 [Tulasnella sp. JGI-2019a]|nr:hypothetical protein FRB93_000759 [Tulasnella sp. JGI-2019a]
MTIKSTPTTANAMRPDMPFIVTVSKCIELCHNLVSFTCTAPALLPFVMTKFVDSKNHKPRLSEVKLEAMTLNLAEATQLAKLQGLRHLTLEAPSRGMLDQLSKWVRNNKEQLTSLSISNSIDLTSELLGYSLAHVSNLKSLSINNCLSITHRDLLRLLNRYPQHALESLALTIYTSTLQADALWPELVSLKNLTIYVRQCGKQDLNPTVISVLGCVSNAALESLTLRNIDRVDTDKSVLDKAIKDHKMTLRKFNLISFMLTADQVKTVCMELKELRQFAVYITMHPEALATALSKAKKLATLIDTQSATGHASRDPNLDSWSVRKLFQKCVGLKTVKITGRTYTAEWLEKSGSKKELKITLQRLRQPFVILSEGSNGKWEL